MPKYTFTCQKCAHSHQKYVNKGTDSIVCPDCSDIAVIQLPSLNGPSRVTEVINKYTGTTWAPNHKEEVKQRREDYYWSVEVPRFVNSGTYSMETMFENGWIWLDDNGHIHTHTIPPNRR